MVCSCPRSWPADLQNLTRRGFSLSIYSLTWGAHWEILVLIQCCSRYIKTRLLGDIAAYPIHVIAVKPQSPITIRGHHSGISNGSHTCKALGGSSGIL